LKRVFHVTLLCILAIALTGCFGASPEGVTKDFFSAVKDGDFNTAAKYVKQDSKDEFRDELESGQDLEVYQRE
jgi:hypothetical protein